MGNVLVAVVPDGRDGTVPRSACALLAVASGLGTPVAVLPAEPGGDAVRTLGRLGAARICHPEPRGAELPATVSDAERSADLLVALARRAPVPTAILLPADRLGHETAARVAVRLDAGLITGAVAVRRGSVGPVAVQRCLAGSYEVESAVVRGVPVITVRPEAERPRPELDPADMQDTPVAPTLPLVEAVALPAPTGPSLESLESAPSPRAAAPALDAADVVVAGGRGLGSAAAFGLVEELAAALGGAAACSRTAAELGWCPRDRSVGLTGRTVRPRLYLASGISGSVRHRAGMQGAGTVVAIDTDASAPLLKLADLGVVGDATRVLPALLAEIRRRRTSPDR